MSIRYAMRKAGLLTMLLLVMLSFDYSRSYQLDKLSDDINSKEYDEISPVLNKEGTQLFFTRIGSEDFERQLILDGEDISKFPSENYYRDRLAWVYSQIAGHEIKDPIRSSFNQDIWMSEVKDHTFGSAQNPGVPLNNALPNSVLATYDGGNSVLLLNQFLPDGGMKSGVSISQKGPGGVWSVPQAVSIEGFSSDGKDISVTTNEDGSIMLLALNNSDGLGDNDIYLSVKTGPFSYSRPKNLGRQINTKYREATPSISADGTTIYFASNRPGSVGGMDIYYAIRIGDGWEKWSKPFRFYYPINSRFDDSQPVFNAASGFLYFTSKRDGSSDIFRSKISEDESFEYANDVVSFSGTTINKSNRIKVSSGLIIKATDYHKILYTAESRSGSYDLSLPKGMDLEILPVKSGFIGHSKNFSFKTEKKYAQIPNIKLYLEPITIGNKLGTSHIFFERSSAKYLQLSKTELRRISKILNNHPEIKITIEGHTDNVGEEGDLQKLSFNRARSVKKYLVQKGVSPSRIKTIGWGHKKPIASNFDEEEKKKNRRVEIYIAAAE